MLLPNQRLHLTPLVGAEAEWTVGTVQETGLLLQVPFWVLVSGFQKISTFAAQVSRDR